MGDRRIFDFMTKPLIGLDIDASRIRAIQLRRRSGRCVVTGAAVADVPRSDGDPQRRRSSTTDAIRQCLDALNTKSRLAVCGLRGPEVVVRGFEFPALPADEVDGAVGLEASQTCPFSMNDSILDYQVTSRNDRKTQGFWAAATHDLVETGRQTVRDAGLKCTLVDIDGLALLNVLTDLKPVESATVEGDESPDRRYIRTAVLNIGDSVTTIALKDQVNRPFIRDLLTGEQEVVRRMVLATKVPPEAVRTALYEDAGMDREVFRRGLDTACGALRDDVATTLKYYTAENRLTRIERVLVCGNLATARDFVSTLAEKLSFDVVPWNPVSELQCEAGPECESLLHRVGPTMAVAAGLAMRTI